MIDNAQPQQKSPDRTDLTYIPGATRAMEEERNSEAHTLEFDSPQSEAEAQQLLNLQSTQAPVDQDEDARAAFERVINDVRLP